MTTPRTPNDGDFEDIQPQGTYLFDPQHPLDPTDWFEASTDDTLNPDNWGREGREERAANGNQAFEEEKDITPGGLDQYLYDQVGVLPTDTRKKINRWRPEDQET